MQPKKFMLCTGSKKVSVIGIDHQLSVPIKVNIKIINRFFVIVSQVFCFIEVSYKVFFLAMPEKY